jgi:hypothetical protein
MDAPILRFDRYNRPDSQTPPPGSAVWLEITRGRVRQPIRTVRGPVYLIGTASDCDLVLGDTAFPEAYAYLLVHDDNVTIRRVGDGPELLVNGEPFEMAELVAGDLLAFGSFELALQIQLTTETITPSSRPISGDNWPWLADLMHV